MNYFKTSTGERISKSEIDRKVKAAKKAKLEIQFEEFGYNFCEKCGASSGVRKDCSHIESVKSCQEHQRAEKSFSLDNIRILCRRCHQEFDKLNLQFNKNK